MLISKMCINNNGLVDYTFHIFQYNSNSTYIFKVSGSICYDFSFS